MEDILRSKIECVPKVKAFLSETEDKILAEAVPASPYWGTGLTKTATESTRHTKWPGQKKWDTF